MRKLTEILLMYALAGVMMPESRKSRYDMDLTQDEIDELNQIREKKVIELRRKGMRKFNIKGVEVYALNEKNAIRKANYLLNKTL